MRFVKPPIGAFLLLAALFGATPAHAQWTGQTSGCPLVTKPRIISDSDMTLSTADKCWLLVLTNTGAVTVRLPAPDLNFQPGWQASILPINGATITFTGLQDQAGKIHKINQQTSLAMSAGTGADLLIMQDGNWWARGAGGGAGGNVVGPVSSTAADIALFNNALGTLVTGSGFISVDANASDGAGGGINGNAVFSLTPTLGTVSGLLHQDTMFFKPTTASYAGMTDPNDFYVFVNGKWGDSVTPIPAGTKGNMSFLQCNTNTDQLTADTNGNDGSECVGASMVNTGTGPMNALAFDFRVLGASNQDFLISSQITTNGSTISANVGGFNLIQTGANPVGFGMRLQSGAVTNALDTSGATVTTILKNANSTLSGAGALALGTTTFLRSGFGSGNFHVNTDRNINIFLDPSNGNVAIEGVDDSMGPLVMELLNGVAMPGLPTSGVAAGAVCVTAAKNLFIKTTAGACL